MQAAFPVCSRAGVLLLKSCLLACRSRPRLHLLLTDVQASCSSYRHSCQHHHRDQREMSNVIARHAPSSDATSTSTPASPTRWSYTRCQKSQSQNAHVSEVHVTGDARADSRESKALRKRVEEEMRGWLAGLATRKRPQRLSL